MKLKFVPTIATLGIVAVFAAGCAGESEALTAPVGGQPESVAGVSVEEPAV